MKRWILIFVGIVASPVKATDYKKIQSLLLTPDHQAIVLPAGHFVLERGLTLMGQHLVIRGSGQQATVLDFSTQTHGAEGLLVQGEHITLSNLTLLNPPGDGIKMVNSDHIQLDNIHVLWTEGLSARNGAYGIYPILSKNVLVTQCKVSGASESGIYLGQSEGGYITNNHVTDNTVGIELENTRTTLIENNHVEKNSIGLMISERPGLSQQGKDIFITHNAIRANNVRNVLTNQSHLAQGVDGIGILLIASKHVTLTDNVFKTQNIADIAITHYQTTGFQLSRSRFDPNPFQLVIGQNHFSQPSLRVPHKTARGFLFKLALPAHSSNILWDGKISNRTRFDPLNRYLCRDAQQPAIDFLNHQPGVDDTQNPHATRCE